MTNYVAMKIHYSSHMSTFCVYLHVLFAQHFLLHSPRTSRMAADLLCSLAKDACLALLAICPIDTLRSNLVEAYKCSPEKMAFERAFAAPDECGVSDGSPPRHFNYLHLLDRARTLKDRCHHAIGRGSVIVEKHDQQVKHRKWLL